MTTPNFWAAVFCLLGESLRRAYTASCNEYPISLSIFWLSHQYRMNATADNFFFAERNGPRKTEILYAYTKFGWYYLNLVRTRTLTVLCAEVRAPGQGQYRPVKGKAISFQTLTGPQGSRRLRLPDFKTFST
jgi:hypothetical protein